MLREEVVHRLKAGKTPEVENIPSKLLKNGEEATTVLTAICQKILETKESPKEWAQLLLRPLPKKGNLNQCQNYLIIGLISHPSKTMLQVILNRLKAKARNCCQKNKQVLGEARAQYNRSSIVKLH